MSNQQSNGTTYEQEMAAAVLFDHLAGGLAKLGVPRGPSSTELELAQLAQERLKRDEPLKFVREFYLPLVYGQGPRMILAEAQRLVEAVSGRIVLSSATPVLLNPGQGIVTPSAIPMGDVISPLVNAIHPDSCLRCGKRL